MPFYWYSNQPPKGDFNLFYLYDSLKKINVKINFPKLIQNPDKTDRRKCCF